MPSDEPPQSDPELVADDTPHVDQAMVDALDSLGNRQRLELLFTLAAAEREQQQQPLSMTFSELYDRVDVESSSQFSYHLSQLVGSFVAKAPDGYHLTQGGAKLVRAIRSGVYASTPQFDSVDVSGACPLCGAVSLAATLADERFVVRCDACSTPLVTNSFPLSQARNRTPSEIVASFGSRIWSTHVLVSGAVCPECYGRVDTVVEAHDHGTHELYTHRSTCGECTFVIHVPIEATAAFHPAAVGFLWNHGISLLDLPLWEFFELMTEGVVKTDVRSVDPFEATTTITFADETLRLTIDETMTVALAPTDE